ncbi:homeobox protein 2-like [Pieris rapae]|uniref:homeobox protein 2-like n=1 Tax=Pieris rapae TaxID=64459 RepID=UPI001E280910|nr:homeobox protein 2-like [Pieris rapae]
MMYSVLQMIWILVLTLVTNVRCQDGFNDQNMLRVPQVANEGQIEANTGFNNLHNDANSQNALSTRYQMPEDSANFEFNREPLKPRKVYRIKNPFQNQEEDAHDNTNSQDSDTSASNQYAGMQYSLPPEEFLQQMRAENQYQQQQQQLSTQPSVYSYTATPQPQFLYSTMTAANYANQPNQNVQEQKSFNYYNPNVNSFQYNNANTYGLDASLSTPAPQYLSTSSNQYMSTPANTYISSPSPMYITNPPNLQSSYVSSPYSNTQTGTVDYNTNKVTTTGHNTHNYDNNNIYSKKVQLDHYSNSGNAMRYPANVQYQSYPSSTTSPVSSPYSEDSRDNWGNAASNYNSGVLHKSTQDILASQYSTNPHYRMTNNQDDYKHEANYENVNQDSQRFNTLSTNNMYYSYIQPHNQVNNLKNPVREVDQQMGQTATYSHGDYGWKLDRKPTYGSEISTAGYSGYQNNNAKSDNEAISQVSFHMDTSKPYNYNQISKSSSEKLEADDFVRAATKAHDNYKHQLELNRISNGQYSNNAYTNTDLINSYYANTERNKNKPDNSNNNAFINGNTQSEYVTASPYYVRENFLENKPKQIFDHEKAIKNIVPIDVSNVVQNSNAQLKSSIGIDSNDKFSQNKDQYNRPTSETYYKDKNNVYTFSIKSQPDDYHSLSDRLKQLDLSPQQGKSSDTFLSYNSLPNNKRYVDESMHTNNYGNLNPSNADNLQTSGNIQQNSLQRSQLPSDLAALLKFNDIPLRLTQHLNPDSLRLPGNNFDIENLPNPFPVRLNQNIEQHHVDVASDIISKILAARQNMNKQEPDVQTNNQLSTIHGFKVANPFNIDLKLVSDMLKGKPVLDESQLSSVRDQYSKPVPIKFDLQQIQQLLLKNDNGNSLSSLGIIPSSYFDMYSSNRYPYQGSKYSRSEEEPENIPIAESSNSHLIGAVVEEMGQDTADTTATDDDVESNNDDDKTIKPINSHHRMMGERFRLTNNLGRHMYQRKFPKTMIDQPYPVLKPPHKSRSKLHPIDKINRKRRINKPKHLRIFKTEPLFEANTPSEDIPPAVSTLLKPPPVMEDKSDVVDEEQSGIDGTE